MYKIGIYVCAVFKKLVCQWVKDYSIKTQSFFLNSEFYDVTNGRMSHCIISLTLAQLPSCRDGFEFSYLLVCLGARRWNLLGLCAES